MLRALRRIGVRAGDPEVAQDLARGLGVNAGVQHAGHAADAEDALALGVVLRRDAARVIVAGQRIGADAQLIEIIGQERGRLALADAGAAADGHDNLLRRVFADQAHQLREDEIGLLNVLFADLHAVAGHIAVGDLSVRGERGRRPVIGQFFHPIHTYSSLFAASSMRTALANPSWSQSSVR